MAVGDAGVGPDMGAFRRRIPATRSPCSASLVIRRGPCRLLGISADQPKTTPRRY